MSSSMHAGNYRAVARWRDTTSYDGVMPMRTRLLVVVVTLLAAVPGLRAQGPPNVDAEAERLFNVVMSPYCPGRVLANCPSGAAETLRQEVRLDLEAGRSAAEIEAALYRRFGDSIRGLPKATGVGLLAWVVPAVAFGLSGIWLALWLRRSTPSNAERAEPSASPVSQVMLDRLDDELADLS